jgi:hypothetical protein
VRRKLPSLISWSIHFVRGGVYDGIEILWITECIDLRRGEIAQAIAERQVVPSVQNLAGSFAALSSYVDGIMVTGAEEVDYTSKLNLSHVFPA